LRPPPFIAQAALHGLRESGATEVLAQVSPCNLAAAVLVAHLGVAA
jgi:hypothetical protein